MRIKEVVRTRTEKGQAVVEIVNSEETRDDIYMSPDVTAALMAGLVRAAVHLQRQGHGFQQGPTYSVAGCYPTEVDGREQGLVFTMNEGFDIVLTLSPPMLATLKACIAQLASSPPDGRIH